MKPVANGREYNTKKSKENLILFYVLRFSKASPPVLPAPSTRNKIKILLEFHLLMFIGRKRYFHRVAKNEL